MADWLIRHRWHNGDLVHSIEPENLKFTQNLNAPHDITYEISLDNPVLAEKNTAEGDPLGSYQHDWYLFRDGKAVPGMAGMITSLSLTESDEVLLVSGKSWLHYLERRHFPFDPANPPPTIPIVYQRAEVDMSRHLHDIMFKVISRPNSLAIDISDLGHHADPDDITTDWFGLETFNENVEIDFGDTEDIQSKFSQWAEGKPGFDYSIDEHKVFRMYYPEYGTDADANPIIQWILTVAQAPVFNKSTSSLIRQGTTWTDNGPMGTHVLATGTAPVVGNDTVDINGDPAAQRSLALGSIDGQLYFRRLDFTVDVGSAASPAKVKRLAKGALRAGVRPQREVPIKVAVEDIPDFYTKFHVGNYFQAIVPMGAHTITGTKKITAVEVEVTNEGEETAIIHNTLWRGWFDVESAEPQA